MFTVESSWFSSSLGSELEKFFSKVGGCDKFDCAKIIQATQYFRLFVCLNGTYRRKKCRYPIIGHVALRLGLVLIVMPLFQGILGTEQTFLSPRLV